MIGEGKSLELAKVFLKLGTIAFGGPAAHIAMMEEEVVRRRGWLTHEEFLDLFGATNLIPGPNSTELAIHIGHRRAGWPGLLLAGICFTLPAVLIVTGLAWVYVKVGSLPEVAGMLYAVKPVIIVIILQALFMLGRKALKTKWLTGLAGICVSLNLLGVNEVLVLIGAVFLILVPRVFKLQAFFSGGGAIVGSSFAGSFVSAAPLAAALPFSLGGLFLFFLKVGSVWFGGGYVLLAFLRGDLVERWRWITEGQLLDAVAVGQVTPGPLFTTATFVGYILGGLPGAAVATAGIFLPALFFVALSGPFIPRLRASESAAVFLDAINAAAWALMVSVTLQIAGAALVDLFTIALAIISSVALFRFQINSGWLVLVGAIIGLGLVLFGGLH